MGGGGVVRLSSPGQPKWSWSLETEAFVSGQLNGQLNEQPNGQGMDSAEQTATPRMSST